MMFSINTSAVRRQEGTLVTSRNLKDRLERENPHQRGAPRRAGNSADAFKVSGRGELQMAILIETMRREGFELSASKPEVIVRDINGAKNEPMEQPGHRTAGGLCRHRHAEISSRKGRMANMVNHGTGRVRLEYRIPSRGLIGFRSQFLTDTRGTGLLKHLFDGYEPWQGEIPHRHERRTGRRPHRGHSDVLRHRARAGARRNVREAVTRFTRAWSSARTARMATLRQPHQSEEVTNIRQSTSDIAVHLFPAAKCRSSRRSSGIAATRCVEVTPKSCRLRKRALSGGRTRPPPANSGAARR